MEIELSGHTDTRGNPELLLILSNKRVKAVKDYLIKKGVLSGRIKGEESERIFAFTKTGSSLPGSNAIQVCGNCWR